MPKFNRRKYEHLRRKVFGIKRVINNRLTDSYGQSDVDTGKVEINKSAHKNKKLKRVNKNPNGDTESLVDTMVHEEMHVRHPKMHEKTVRKKAKKVVARLSQKQKAKIRSRYH